MKRLLSYLFAPRGLAVLAIVVGSCFLSFKYSAHHEADGVFQELYMHLVPSPLVIDNHAEHDALEPLVEVPVFVGLFDWRGEHGEGHTPTTVLFNLQIFQVAAILMLFVCFGGVARYLRTGKGDPISKLFAGFAMWLRDDVVYPTFGKANGRKFLPFFLCIFFFILFMNLMGLAPYSATATASIFVTGALASITFGAMLICGMVVQGPLAYWKNLVPHVPLPLWPLMFVCELIGLVVKPFALMIRLFANMSGGHMVVLSFMGLIFFLGSPSMWGSAGGWGASPVGVGFAVFIMIIEGFVALLQAFVFTQLSVIFVNAAVHPEH